MSLWTSGRPSRKARYESRSVWKTRIPLQTRAMTQEQRRLIGVSLCHCWRTTLIPTTIHSRSPSSHVSSMVLTSRDSLQRRIRESSFSSPPSLAISSLSTRQLTSLLPTLLLFVSRSPNLQRIVHRLRFEMTSRWPSVRPGSFVRLRTTAISTETCLDSVTSQSTRILMWCRYLASASRSPSAPRPEGSRYSIIGLPTVCLSPNRPRSL